MMFQRRRLYGEPGAPLFILRITLFCILLAVSASCKPLDWNSDDYSEELTSKLFLNEPDIHLVERVESIDVYKVSTSIKSGGWRSGKWLKKNADEQYRIDKPMAIKKYITSLHYNGAPLPMMKLGASGVEYHIIPHLKSGEKGYIRVMETLAKDSTICKVKTYSGTTYRVSKQDKHDNTGGAPNFVPVAQ